MKNDAERALVGSVLLKPRQFSRLCDLVDPDDFSDPFFGWAWASMARLSMAQKGISISAVTQLAPEKHDKVQETLEQCLMDPEFYDLPDHLARNIRDAAVKRRLSDVAQRAVEMAGDAEMSPEGLLGVLETDLAAAMGQRQKGGAVMIGAGTDEWLAEAFSDAPRSKGLSTGLVELDDTIGGLNPGDLVVLAGRPSMGKTALALSLLRGTMIKSGVGAHMQSMEMDQGKLRVRLATDLAREVTRVAYTHIGRRRLFPHQKDALAQAGEIIKALPLRVDCRPRRTAAQVMASARRSAQFFESQGMKLGLVVIDYLQIMEVDRAFANNLSYAIGQISGSMKGLAEELGCTVVLLSQLSREVEKRDDKRPMLSDLRQSGEIEQDADVVGFVLRPEYYVERDERASDEDRADARNLMKLFIDKNRQGPIRTINLYCDIACNAVRDADYDFQSGKLFERAV